MISGCVYTRRRGGKNRLRHKQKLAILTKVCARHKTNVSNRRVTNSTGKITKMAIGCRHESVIRSTLGLGYRLSSKRWRRGSGETTISRITPVVPPEPYSATSSSQRRSESRRRGGQTGSERTQIWTHRAGRCASLHPSRIRRLPELGLQLGMELLLLLLIG